MPCRLAAIALWLSLASGCAMLHPKPKLDATVGLFEKASLTYQLDAAKLNTPVALSRIEGQLVSYDQVASGPLPERSTGKLQIVYPHPDGRGDMAEARVIISSGTTADEHARHWWQPRAPKDVLKVVPPAKCYEEWALDLPKPELDRLFEQLRATNYFRHESPSGATVQVATQLDGRELHKSWSQVPELESLMQRVRGQGKLVAYRREGSGPASGNKLTSSAATYQQLVAQDRAPIGGATATSQLAGNTGLPANRPASSGLDMPAGRWTPQPGVDASTIATVPGERR